MKKKVVIFLLCLSFCRPIIFSLSLTLANEKYNHLLKVANLFVSFSFLTL